MNMEHTQSQTEKRQTVSGSVGSIAHDLTNLLCGMSICTSLLEDEFAENEESRKLLKQFHLSIESARKLTAQLRVLSKDHAA